MATRTNLIVDAQPIAISGIDRLIDLFEKFPEIVNDIVVEEVNEVRPEILDDLGYTPGPVKYPIEWASEKQRKAFFATKGFGKGIPVPRTGGISRAWFVEPDVQQNLGTASITIGNTDPAAEFVYGYLFARPGRIQQPYHHNTGWLLVEPTIDYHVEAITEDDLPPKFKSAIIAFLVGQ